MASRNTYLMYIMAIIWLISSDPFPVIGSNVLIVPMSGEGSHYFLAQAIGKELVKRRHNVTFLLGDMFKETIHQIDKINHVYFKSHATMDQYHYYMESCTLAGLKGEYLSFAMTNTSWQTDITNKECNSLLRSTAFKSQLQNSRFDIAVTDVASPCPIAKTLGIPYVLFSPIMILPSAYLLANRNEVNPSYMPDMFRGYDHKMTFRERLLNTLSTVIFAAITNIVVQPLEDDLKTEHNLPADASMYYTDAELWLVNSHVSLDFPRPLLPNTKFIGGLTTKASGPLPKVCNCASLPSKVTFKV